ncbi:cytochrome b N-terminal domain-containing protein [Vampirovibrio sp.]|uniref:cytochrome b N-terminal domain-containing protein n=1 Tax=Vampirovibrio sp. TaxID=2717857 RepID=UPI0035930110
MYTEPLQKATLWLEKGLNDLFSQKYNPFYYHGALPNFFIWALFISGLLLFAYYQPTLATAYASVRYITFELPFGNLFRSIHRYASDGMMIFVMLHMFRVWFTDRYREYRIVPWVTGVVLLIITFTIGLTGYLLIWDQEAVTLANMTFNLVSKTPLIGSAVAEFLIAGKMITDYTLTRMMFLHLGIPLFMMFMLWLHYLRITRPVSEPPLALVVMLSGVLFLFSAAFPVSLQILNANDPLATPSLTSVSSVMNFDLLYAWPQYLAAQQVDPLLVVLLVLAVPVGLLILPYLQKKALRDQFATVVRENCTGCSLCYNDCPYEAIEMVDRGNDGTRFKRLAVVDPGRCANCGLCVGACAFKAIEIPRRETNNVLAEIEAALTTS